MPGPARRRLVAPSRSGPDVRRLHAAGGFPHGSGGTGTRTGLGENIVIWAGRRRVSRPYFSRWDVLDGAKQALESAEFRDLRRVSVDHLRRFGRREAGLVKCCDAMRRRTALQRQVAAHPHSVETQEKDAASLPVVIR